MLANLPTKTQVESELYKRSLYRFVRSAWSIVEPATPFIDNWHIQAICKYLETSYNGMIRNLIINIPPRCMKSRIVNTFFPAWVWTKKPSAKFLALSATDELAKNAARDCQRLINSEWYQSRWPIQLQRKQEARFDNANTGQFLSFGIHSAFTGEGADFILMDDLISATNSFSDTELDNVNRIYDNSVVSRLNDPKQGVKILIMQRLSTNDLVGHLQEKEKGNWEELILPMRYEGVRFTSSIEFVDPRREKGDLLWPERFGEGEVANLEKSLGELGTAGQLQQRPTPITGAIFKREWFTNRVEAGSNKIILSIDTAFSEKESADYTAIIVGNISPEYVLGVKEFYHEKVGFPELAKVVEDLVRRYSNKLYAVLIESKGSGISLIQTLKEIPELEEFIIGINPKGDKVERASLASLWAEKGMVTLPPPSMDHEYLINFEDELFNFPAVKHDDFTDAFSQMILACEDYLAEGFRYRNSRSH